MPEEPRLARAADAQGVVAGDILAIGLALKLGDEQGDEVAGGDVVPREDGLLDGDSLVKTDVRVELGLDVGEGVDRAISTATTELALGREGRRESNRVVEDASGSLISKR